MPKSDKTSGEDALHQQIQKLLGLRPAGPRISVTRFESWEIVPVPHAGGGDDQVNVLAIGLGEPRVVEFDDDMLQATLQWLASDENAWLEQMRRAMGGLRGGEMARPDLLPDDQIIVDGLYELLQVAGDLGMSDPVTVNGEAALRVDTLFMASQLATLRTALVLALALQRVDEPSKFWRSIESEMENQEPGVTTQLHQHFGDPQDARSALARLWLVAGMNELQLGTMLEVGNPADPFRIDSGPRSPEQLIWFVVALSAGAIVPPYPMPGVFQCAYHLCRKVFVSRKLGVGGTRRFCSVAHGKRFHAARRMKEKSKANASQPETKDG